MHLFVDWASPPAAKIAPNPKLAAVKCSKFCLDEGSAFPWQIPGHSICSLGELRAGIIWEKWILRVANVCNDFKPPLSSENPIISSFFCCRAARNSLGASLLLINFPWKKVLMQDVEQGESSWLQEGRRTGFMANPSCIFQLVHYGSPISQKCLQKFPKMYF